MLKCQTVFITQSLLLDLDGLSIVRLLSLIFCRLPMVEITMLLSVSFGFLVWMLHVCPTFYPIIDPVMFGKGKIVEINQSGSVLENEYGVRVSITSRFNHNMMGQVWSLKEHPGFYSLDKHYVDGEERNY